MGDEQKKIIKDYMMITIGFFIVALSLTIFLIPADLAVGGITGLAMVIHRILPSMSVGMLVLAMNVILFGIAFLSIGLQFGTKSIYASLGLSLSIWLLERYLPFKGVLTEDVMLNLIYGILIQAIGMAIIFYENASTGGTDIVAKMLNKFFHLDIGKALLAADFIVTVMAIFTFGTKLGLYALLGVIFNGFIIDGMIAGLHRKMHVFIVSFQPETIKEFIINDLGRGATVYHGEGAYTNSPRKVIMAVMNKKEFIQLKGYIRKTDPQAFVTVGIVHEVLGKGFITNESW